MSEANKSLAKTPSRKRNHYDFARDHLPTLRHLSLQRVTRVSQHTPLALRQCPKPLELNDYVLHGINHRCVTRILRQAEHGLATGLRAGGTERNVDKHLLQIEAEWHGLAALARQ